MEPDIDELSRVDVDGEPAYSAEDFMNGEVVIRNENYGYWNLTYSHVTQSVTVAFNRALVI
jgi:hypothetical protein